MNWLKILLFMLGFLFFELIIGFLLYILAVNFKILFLIFSLIVISFMIGFIFYSKHREKKKIFPLEKIYQDYRKLATIIISFIFGGWFLFILFSIVLLFLNK